MRHLLGCAMFVQTENGSYIQVSGVAASEMLMGSTGAAPDSGENAVPRECSAENPLAALDECARRLCARLIPRYMIFYGDDRHICNIANVINHCDNSTTNSRNATRVDSHNTQLHNNNNATHAHTRTRAVWGAGSGHVGHAPHTKG